MIRLSFLKTNLWQKHCTPDRVAEMENAGYKGGDIFAGGCPTQE